MAVSGDTRSLLTITLLVHRVDDIGALTGITAAVARVGDTGAAKAALVDGTLEAVAGAWPKALGTEARASAVS